MEDKDRTGRKERGRQRERVLKCVGEGKKARDGKEREKTEGREMEKRERKEKEREK